MKLGKVPESSFCRYEDTCELRSRDGQGKARGDRTFGWEAECQPKEALDLPLLRLSLHAPENAQILCSAGPRTTEGSAVRLAAAIVLLTKDNFGIGCVLR